MNRLILLMAILFFADASQVAAQNAIDANSILVIPQDKPLPGKTKKLGTIKAGNNSTCLHCDYESVIQQAKIKAKKMGGNVVKITKLISPSFISNCYRIQADVLYTDSLVPYKIIYLPKQQEAFLNKTSGTSQYALLYIYRLADTVLFAPSYSLHMGKDSVICEVRSKTKEVIKLYKEGKIEFWAEKGDKRSVILDVHKGAQYYLRCGTQMGEVKQIPLLEIMNNEAGKREYDQLNPLKKNMGKSYFDQYH